MIECASCHTLNPDAESTCLACGARLSRPAQTGSATVGLSRCPAGHPIDPSWKTCPYCDRQQAPAANASLPAPSRSTRLEPALDPVSAGPQRTRLEGAAGGGDRRTRLEGEASWPAPPASRPGPRPTRLEDPEVPTSGRRTVLQEGSPVAPVSGPVVAPPPLFQEGAAAALPSAPDPNAPARRLLAVLAAPDLGPGGAVFPVRAGKNTLGASPSNDIVLAGDSEVSGEHAVILHRNGTFHLTDRLSTNGTWVNGEEVPANGTLPLRNLDRIRCGRTELVLLVIEPAGSSAAR